MTTNDIDAIRKLADAATPGPWEVGYRWLVAGVADHLYGTGKCAYCQHFGEPVWVGMDDINGTKMLAHHHRDNGTEVNPHEITADVRHRIAGNYDYEAGGVVEPADAEFIAAARTLVPALCDEIEHLRAERDQLFTTLAHVLGNFHEKGYPGRPCIRTGWVREETYAKWHGVLAGIVAAGGAEVAR